MQFDINTVKEHLPQRYPFLMIDRVVACEPGVSLTALKNVTAGEPFFQGHFPHHPIMPGVLIVEAMAQACSLLATVTAGQTINDNRVYLFAGLDKVRFKRPVAPGDQLFIHVGMERRVKNLWRCAAEAKVDGKQCCTANLLFTYRNLS